MEISATSTSEPTHTKETLEPRARAHDHHRALQQKVLDVALERLAECLASPSELARGVCAELGVAHGDLAEAFRRRQLLCFGDQRLDGVCKDPSQVRPCHKLNFATATRYNIQNLHFFDTMIDAHCRLPGRGEVDFVEP